MYCRFDSLNYLMEDIQALFVAARVFIDGVPQLYILTSSHIDSSPSCKNEVIQ